MREISLTAMPCSCQQGVMRGKAICFRRLNGLMYQANMDKAGAVKRPEHDAGRFHLMLFFEEDEGKKMLRLVIPQPTG